MIEPKSDALIETKSDLKFIDNNYNINWYVYYSALFCFIYATIDKDFSHLAQDTHDIRLLTLSEQSALNWAYCLLMFFSDIKNSKKLPEPASVPKKILTLHEYKNFSSLNEEHVKTTFNIIACLVGINYIISSHKTIKTPPKTTRIRLTPEHIDKLQIYIGETYFYYYTATKETCLTFCQLLRELKGMEERTDLDPDRKDELDIFTDAEDYIKKINRNLARLEISLPPLYAPLIIGGKRKQSNRRKQSNIRKRTIKRRQKILLIN